MPIIHVPLPLCLPVSTQLSLITKSAAHEYAKHIHYTSPLRYKDLPNGRPGVVTVQSSNLQKCFANFLFRTTGPTVYSLPLELWEFISTMAVVHQTAVHGKIFGTHAQAHTRKGLCRESNLQPRFWCSLSANTALLQCPIFFANSIFLCVINLRNCNALLEIPANAFKRCTNLKVVRLPATVVSIGASAFSDCANWREHVTFSNVIAVGDSAFKNSGILSLNIPKLTMVAPNLCGGCRSLTTVRFKSVMVFAPFMFSGCTALETVVFSRNCAISARDMGVFEHCRSLKELDCTISGLAERMFFECKLLTRIGSVSTVPYLANECFTSTRLAVKIPSTVVRFGFGCCANTAVDMRDGVDKNGFFSHTQVLQPIASAAFQRSHFLLTSVSLTLVQSSSQNVISGDVFRASNLKRFKLVLQTSIARQVIGKRVFADCRDLKSVHIQCNAQLCIGAETFRNCLSLVSVLISTPPAVQDAYSVVFGKMLFLNCCKLQNVVCPERTHFSWGIFDGCVALERIETCHTSVFEFYKGDNVQDASGVQPIANAPTFCPHTRSMSWPGFIGVSIDVTVEFGLLDISVAKCLLASVPAPGYEWENVWVSFRFVDLNDTLVTAVRLYRRERGIQLASNHTPRSPRVFYTEFAPHPLYLHAMLDPAATHTRAEWLELYSLAFPWTKIRREQQFVPQTTHEDQIFGTIAVYRALHAGKSLVSQNNAVPGVVCHTGLLRAAGRDHAKGFRQTQSSRAMQYC